ncbi:MAG: four helix bundle protein [Bacteroidota bacterium]
MNENILLEDLEIYQSSQKIGEAIWAMVMKWEYFERKALGEQLIRAADSIAANIAEGYGRYFFKDRKQFCYYSRGSLMETKAWLAKAFQRKLISEIEYEALLSELKNLHFKLNVYIKKLRQNSE